MPVWSCEITDQPGSVSEKLAFLAQANANLEYIFTKRLPQKPGFGVLYVAPVTGPKPFDYEVIAQVNVRFGKSGRSPAPSCSGNTHQE